VTLVEQVILDTGGRIVYSCTIAPPRNHGQGRVTSKRDARAARKP
jgi:hypothetical protein